MDPVSQKNLPISNSTNKKNNFCILHNNSGIRPPKKPLIPREGFPTLPQSFILTFRLHLLPESEDLAWDPDPPATDQDPGAIRIPQLPEADEWNT
jgi:hypothetical protein